MTLLLYLCECKLERDKTFLFGMGERIRWPEPFFAPFGMKTKGEKERRDSFVYVAVIYMWKPKKMEVKK